MHDQLFIQQWQATMSAIESKDIEPLLKFREAAMSRRLWESVREADLFTVKVRFDQKLLDHLYFGTPMVSYRERIQALLKAKASDHYIFGSNDGILLNLNTGRVHEKTQRRIQKDPVLCSERKLHQVLIALLRDFYAPRNTGNLFSELYPDEYFDINSSPLRIRQLLFRTRQWLKENRLPASIEQQNGTYSLAIAERFGIQMQLNSKIETSVSPRWRELSAVFSVGQSFKAEEACKKLNWPRTTFRRVADAAMEVGALQKTGIGKSTTYQIKNSSRKTTYKSAA